MDESMDNEMDTGVIGEHKDVGNLHQLDFLNIGISYVLGFSHSGNLCNLSFLTATPANKLV